MCARDATQRKGLRIPLSEQQFRRRPEPSLVAAVMDSDVLQTVLKSLTNKEVAFVANVSKQWAVASQQILAPFGAIHHMQADVRVLVMDPKGVNKLLPATSIPVRDLRAMSKLWLSVIFENEQRGDGLYL